MILYSKFQFIIFFCGINKTASVKTILVKTLFYLCMQIRTGQSTFSSTKYQVLKVLEVPSTSSIKYFSILQVLVLDVSSIFSSTLRKSLNQVSMSIYNLKFHRKFKICLKISSKTQKVGLKFRCKHKISSKAQIGS